MDNIISIELFKQVYKFKTDLDQEVTREAVVALQNAVQKIMGDAAGNTPVSERQAVLMMAALDIASDQIRLKQQYEELLGRVKSCSDSLVAKLGIEL